MEIRRLDARDQPAMDRFVARIPDGDRTFFKEDVRDPAVLASWTRRGAVQSIAVGGDDVIGYVAVIPLHAWSSHVGEVRVVVDPDHRGHGVGRALGRYAVVEAVRIGLRKLVVEVIAGQESTIAMFRSLGFRPEALLEDHVRDQEGGVRDLMVLSHSVDDSFASMATIGLGEAL
jgi:L-amino acid N-acyltransferase YncA